MLVGIGVVGFRGYSGAEAVRILQHHPACEPVLMEHRDDGGSDTPLLRKSSLRSIPASAESARQEGVAAVLLATPHAVSMELAGAFLDAGIKVIDLSGAFRLGSAEQYQEWYGEPHTAASLLPQAVYGLPEFYREQIRGANLVANPGCYPTAANLAIRPLVDANLFDPAAGIICDAKSGTSGAGRKPTLKTSFCEVTENFSAYSILKHRHVPEVLQNSHLDAAAFSFTAQLLPLDRGILETIYVRTLKPMEAEALIGEYHKFYEDEPFVRLYKPGSVPDLHAIQRTNFCDIGLVADSKSCRAVVVSAIDNLGKGAAGQAIQNLNLVLGLEETAGLL